SKRSTKTSRDRESELLRIAASLAPFGSVDVRLSDSPHQSTPSITRAGDRSQRPLFFVANRAHHADIGGATPGSMGLATDVYGEGLRIPPIRIMRGGESCDDVMKLILTNVRSSNERRADFEAQIGSLRVGEMRLLEIVERRGQKEARDYAQHLILYSS